MRINFDSKKKETGTLPKNESFSFFTGFNKIFHRFSDKQKEDFYREFSTLIRAGVDFNQALTILTNQQKSTFLKSVYKEITSNVVKGKTLNESIQNYSFFSPYEFYSIQIGEETKRLPEVFDQLKKFFTRKIKMKRQITSVLAYPTFILVITFAVLYFMLTYVVPMFANVFKQFGKELPKITQFVVKLSNNFGTIVIFFLSCIVIIFIVHNFLKKRDSYKNIITHVILKIPFFGNLIKKIYLARFCQSLSLLISTKTSLITALELTEKMISFYPLKIALKEAKRDVLKGGTFASSLQKHTFFSKKIISLTIIGERINQLDKMYDGLANQYNDDIEHSTKMIGAILEPLMIVIIGSIVGFIMVAMYSPLFDLSKIIGN
jgi:type IV pilus assembly protein PilC